MASFINATEIYKVCQIYIKKNITNYIYIHIYTYMYIHMMTSAVLYSLTRATLMSPGKDEARFCGYIRSEFIHRAVWRTLMRTECFYFVHHTTIILAKLSTWCFEHSDVTNCSPLVNPSHTDES